MKCKTLAKECGVTAMQIGRMRKQFAPNEVGDLSEDSVEFIRDFFSELSSDTTAADMEEAVKPRFVDSVCSYTQEGRHEVECKFLTEKGVETVRALIPFTTESSHLKGKPMKLEVIEHEDVKYYRHASLAGKAWSQI
jgi:hypothetical protein